MLKNWSALKEKEIKEKRVYILNMDTNAKKIFFFLLQNRVSVAGFVIKEKKNKKKLYGLNIFSLDEIVGENIVYITEKESWQSFKHSIAEDNVYLIDPDEFDKNEFVFTEKGQIRKCNAALMVTMILSRIKKRKAIFLINSKNHEFWTNLLNVLKDEVSDAQIISIDMEMEKIYELIYMEMENLLIFICLFDRKQNIEIANILMELGLKQTQNFISIYNSFSGTVTDGYCGFDWLLGNSFKQEEEFPGFYIHGNGKKESRKIVLLGNSATDPLFYPQKSWSEMLWEECEESQIDITIYNGAITDYNSTNEVIKLFRDVLLLKPDTVISYSGIIDFRQYVPEYPYLNLNLMRTGSKWEKDNEKEVIYGIKDGRSAYERWILNEKIMHEICTMNGISFYGVLQPWIGSECMDAGEKLQIWSDYYWQIVFPQFDNYVHNAKEFKEKIQIDIKENEWLYDFTNIFSEVDDSEIYFDSIHVNEYGNYIVAQAFRKILGLIINANKEKE